jgi:hypothetical protein
VTQLQYMSDWVGRAEKQGNIAELENNVPSSKRLSAAIPTT